MLTIYEIACPSAEAKRYYATADYYSQGQETVGQWGGILAKALGLEGKVKKDDFDRMVDNLHPDTGEQLTPRMKDNRRIGYDFTVSLNKSASILRAFAGEADAKAAGCGARPGDRPDDGDDRKRHANAGQGRWPGYRPHHRQFRICRLQPHHLAAGPKACRRT